MLEVSGSWTIGGSRNPFKFNKFEDQPKNNTTRNTGGHNLCPLTAIPKYVYK